jgi:hypothetical protein
LGLFTILFWIAAAGFILFLHMYQYVVLLLAFFGTFLALFCFILSIGLISWKVPPEANFQEQCF